MSPPSVTVYQCITRSEKLDIGVVGGWVHSKFTASRKRLSLRGLGLLMIVDTGLAVYLGSGLKLVMADTVSKEGFSSSSAREKQLSSEVVGQGVSK